MTRKIRAVSQLIAVSVGVLLLASCASDPILADVTEDGLVRAPSSPRGAVYRAPGVPFFRFQKILLEPLSVSFEPGWEKAHPDVSEKDIAGIRAAAAELFRDEFTRELRANGRYTLVDAPGPDVIKVAPAVIDLDIPAPPSSKQSGVRTYVNNEGTMTLVANLHDSVSGALIGRVLDQQRAQLDNNGKFQLSNSITNAFEARIAFRHWAQLLREGLDVAKNERQPDSNLAPR